MLNTNKVLNIFTHQQYYCDKFGCSFKFSKFFTFIFYGLLYVLFGVYTVLLYDNAHHLNMHQLSNHSSIQVLFGAILPLYIFHCPVYIQVLQKLHVHISVDSHKILFL